MECYSRTNINNQSKRLRSTALGLPSGQLLPKPEWRTILCWLFGEILHWHAGKINDSSEQKSYISPRTRLSITTSWTEQSTFVKPWASVMPWQGGSSPSYLKFQSCIWPLGLTSCPWQGTPARSASRAWSGSRCTWRTRSWSPSSQSILNRTTA